MDIPFKTFNKTDFPLLDDSDVGSVYGILYGKVSAIKLTCINSNVDADSDGNYANAIYKLPENTTDIGTAYIEVDDVFKSATVVTADYTRGLLTISNGRSSAGSSYSVKLVNCVGYIKDSHSYPRQILEHFFANYGNIAYTASNFDTETWESELDNVQVQGDIGFLLNDSGTDFWTAVYDISRKSKSYFRVDYNSEGKIYAKLIDFTRSSSGLIPSCDIHNIDSISLQSSRESVYSSVVVKYGKNYFGSTFLSVSDTTYEIEVKRNYRKIESVEEETFLVNVDDAKYRAYKHSTLYSVIPYTVELELFKNYDLDLYDVITVSLSADNLSSSARKFAGNVDCLVIKVNPKETEKINYVTVQIINNRAPLEMQSFVMSGEYTTVEKEKSSIEIIEDDLYETKKVYGYITTPAPTLSALSDGTVSDYDLAKGTFIVMNGLAEVTGNGPVYSISSKSDSIEGAIDSTTGAYLVSSLSTLSGFMTFLATFKEVDVLATMIVTKATKGDQGEQGSGSFVTIVDVSETTASYTDGQMGQYSGYFYIWSVTGTGTGKWNILSQSQLSALLVYQNLSFDDVADLTDTKKSVIDNSGNKHNGIARNVSMVNTSFGKGASILSRTSYVNI